MTTRTAIAAAMSEDELQANVLDLCRVFGLLVYFTHDSRRSPAGFPDLVITGSRGVLFRELKTARGRVSPAQMNWIAALQLAGADADVWRPVDWPATVREQLDRIRRP